MSNNILENKRHTLAHLLAAAVMQLWPETNRTIGPAIDNGFYYDFEFKKPISDKDLEKIEEAMRKILPSWTKMSGREVSTEEAKEMYLTNPFKLELIDEIVEKGEKLSVYKSGEYEDLCRGGHLENPSSEITPDSFRLSHVAGAYWRGSEKNPMLTRIYGLAFDTKEELDAYITQVEEAKKRDHKKLGKELDLFVFSDLVGPGLPLWTPRGTILRDVLDAFVWELRQERGYVRVDIPHITKKELYQTSGHWDKFGDELMKVSTREGHEFVMKPMNCPHHIQIFNRKLWSYREMPQAYASTTKVYRDEQTGELGGLSRVRSITQDDAHVFVRLNQAKDEIQKIWDIIQTFYGTFGITLTPRLSMHDPENMEKYLGKIETWEKAVEDLRQIIKENGMTAIEAPGEAAFYGPKIDFMGKDALGREHQVATIQLDMNQPERFDLFCVNEHGERERIVMIHAAIMGSIERFLSVIIEHFAGNFPAWMSPLQVKILPITSGHGDYAYKIADELKKAGVRVEVDNENESLGKKIRGAKVEKVPYMLVIGDNELENNMVTVESRDKGKVGEMSPADFKAKILEEISSRSR